MLLILAGSFLPPHAHDRYLQHSRASGAAVTYAPFRAGLLVDKFHFAPALRILPRRLLWYRLIYSPYFSIFQRDFSCRLAHDDADGEDAHTRFLCWLFIYIGFRAMILLYCYFSPYFVIYILDADMSFSYGPISRPQVISRDIFIRQAAFAHFFLGAALYAFR